MKKIKFNDLIFNRKDLIMDGDDENKSILAKISAIDDEIEKKRQSPFVNPEIPKLEEKKMQLIHKLKLLEHEEKLSEVRAKEYAFEKLRRKEDEKIQIQSSIEPSLSGILTVPSSNDANKNKTNSDIIDQDDFIDKFKTACEKRHLVKGKTIPAVVLHNIGLELCPSDMPSKEEFKDKNPMYHKLRQYASLTGYKKKRKQT